MKKFRYTIKKYTDYYGRVVEDCRYIHIMDGYDEEFESFYKSKSPVLKAFSTDISAQIPALTEKEKRVNAHLVKQTDKTPLYFVELYHVIVDKSLMRYTYLPVVQTNTEVTEFSVNNKIVETRTNSVERKFSFNLLQEEALGYKSGTWKSKSGDTIHNFSNYNFYAYTSAPDNVDLDDIDAIKKKMKMNKRKLLKDFRMYINHEAAKPRVVIPEHMQAVPFIICSNQYYAVSLGVISVTRAKLTPMAYGVQKVVIVDAIDKKLDFYFREVSQGEYGVGEQCCDL